MLINRENYLQKIRPFYELDIIKVLIGSRRSGKSKIMELIKNELLDKGICIENILYMNFEDLQFDEINDYKKLNKYVTSKLATGKNYLFFDEIHHVKHFEKAINSFRATIDCSIFITGSNSKLLSKEISSLLTGRIIEFNIYPFTYEESIRFKKLNEISSFDNSFNDFLSLGGYPFRFALQTESDVKNYLNELYNNILENDIFARDSKLEKGKFKKVCEYVLVNAGNDFNPKNICNYLNSNYASKDTPYITEQTIYSYLDKMENAFLAKPIYRYNISGKNALKSNPKYYAIDNGFRLIKANSNNYDRGKFLENVICIELLSRGYEVYIGKTYKGEIDFVVIKDSKKCFIQVSYIMENDDTIKREFGAFSPIKDASPKFVLSLDPLDMSRDGITHINIIDFLLHKKDIFLT